jgi:hypothetical protein
MRKSPNNCFPQKNPEEMGPNQQNVSHLVKVYRVIQKECKIVHAYFSVLWCAMGAQTGGKILPIPEHFENMHNIKKYCF